MHGTGLQTIPFQGNHRSMGCRGVIVGVFCRARERLENAREDAKRPGAEKAARTQELHKALRVSY